MAGLRSLFPGRAGALDWRLLDPAAGLVAEPIRAEVLGSEGFTQLGDHLARSHGPTQAPGPRFAFVPRLRENLCVLRRAQRVLAIQSGGQETEGPAAAWLQDNLLDVIAQTQALHVDLPRGYYEDLPALRVEGQSGLPRIYAIAWHYLAHADGEVDLSLLGDLLNAYQHVHPLQQAELWALPTTLRILLAENLRRLAERVAAEAAARRLAHRLCDALRHPVTARAPLDCFTLMKQRGTADAFALQILQRLHADSDTGSMQGAAAREALRALLEAALPDPPAALEALQAHAAADSLSVSRSIGALNDLARADWRTLITRCSTLVRQLSDWPPFAAEDIRTQDRTLHEIERLARRSACTQAQVAEQLLELATESTPAAGQEPVESLGYWLTGHGAARLQARLGLRPRSGRPSPDLRVTGLLAALGTLCLLLVLGFMHGALQGPVDAGLWLLLAALALLPASEITSAVVHRLLSESIVPQRLPRLAFETGIPSTCRVLVVMPVLLDRLDILDALVRQLECHHLANREDCAQFGLLADFTDAATAETPADAGLLAHAQKRIRALNQRHPGAAGEPPRFLLLQRTRRWSQGEACWMGWERKRGKLEALISMLATGGPSPFLDVGAMSRCAAGTRYVVTLDADTVMPPGTLRELVAVAAHPLNRPRLGQRPGEPVRVMAGHAILQPRLQTLWPAVRSGSLFHQLFSGAVSGHQAYGGPASDVYQDLFHEGSFCGKGLLDVAAVHQVLGHRLPDAQILSHDLIEGCIARCGGVNDLNFLEPFPQHADVASARLHRWTRGDWQLLPLMRQPRRYGLSLLDQWKLVDNLRRSLVAPASLLLLLLALGGAPLSPWAALGLAACAFGCAPLLSAIAGLAPARDDVALAPFGRQALREFLRGALSVAWHLALWLQQSLLALDAIGRTLWRNGVSHQGLLAWTTAADAERRAPLSLRAQVAVKAPVTLLAAGLGVLLWGLNTPAPALSLGLCLAWAATPVWIALTARLPAPSPAPCPDDRRYLLAVARETWTWFADQVDERSHHLPPDNVQTLPRIVVAQRTSPTNIGLYLLSATCAQAFGWLTPQALLARLGATLDTLERLPKERGHLMNWIATDTLEPLAPAYVSTVDSGNLCGHLIAVAGACEALGAAQCPEDPEALGAGEPADLRRALLAQAGRCRRLAEAADFGFLYDPKRRLLHLGWRVAEQRLDPGHYDLLASESRLASLWAMAKGDVPPAHWAALGRPFLAVGCDVGLRSWSGSLFEYLMPQLILAEPPESVLGCAARLAIAEQRRDARARGQPWGVSESAYAATDRTLAYQYAPQGVASLAQRRAPAQESVVAPYASALAAMWDAAAATHNLTRLQALHMRTCWGFYESLDFTPGRQRDGSASTRVQTYMAHHQGMTLVALAQVLLDGQPRRWALSDTRLAAMQVLLQESVPREVPRRRRAPPDLRTRVDPPDVAPIERAVRPGEEVLARTHLLSNAGYREAGSARSAWRPVYSVALRANGAGWSRYGEADITRWRDDALRDLQGHFLYLRRPGEATPVSLTLHPAPSAEAIYSARFLRDRVCFDAVWPDLHARCTVWVCPEDDVEFRRVELWNTSSRALTLSLMSAFEASLSNARADEMHPAFAKLFINARWDADAQALYLDRRPRTADEAALHVVHFIAQTDAPGTRGAAVLADRARWLGRLQTAWAPRADFDDGPSPSGPLETGLDPVAAMSVPLTLAAHGTVQCTWATAAATDMSALTALVDRHRQPGAVDRASQLSDTLHSLRQGEAQGDDEERRAIQALTSLLVQLHARPVPAAQTCDRRSLWRLGLSGERPLLAITVSSLAGLPLVHTLLRALRSWSQGGVGVDLVLINGEPLSYLKPVAQALRALSDASALDLPHGPPASRGSVVLVALDDLNPVERSTLHLLARVRLNADGRPLARHVADIKTWHEGLRSPEASRVAAPDALPPTPRSLPAPGRPFDGGFRPPDGAYGFSTSSDAPPWHPWVNVLANADFGTVVSERGAGWSWAGNSRLNQLSAWSNDPLSDAAREHYALQDLDTGEVWQLAGGDGPDTVERHVVHHPQGTRITQALGDLTVDMHWQVDAVHPLRRLEITLRNRGSSARRMRLLGAIEWLMGAVLVDRQSVLTAHALLTPPEARPLDVMLATQLDAHDGNGGSTAFWAMWARRPVNAARPSRGADGRAEVAGESDWTCDRRELMDRQGRQAWPSRFGRRSGLGTDPCAAAGLRLACAADSICRIDVLLGQGATAETALALAAEALAAPPSTPHVPLDAIQVRSPDPLFDALVNHWLLHQVTASRLWGRAGFYQAGGAYGFRDQLQDVMALVATAPQLVREHLLRAAARQFKEGDVQHWWHPHSGAGVRTRCSDDLLWLPHATLHYVDTTQDSAVLEVEVPFLEAPALDPGEDDAYTTPERTSGTATLYEHCARALDARLQVGAHGLPLMGSGDWNDGMNRVGAGGRGESVWLGWFLCRVVADMTPLAARRGDAERVARWQTAAEGWRRALEGPAWTGHWYARAFFDDGTPLGTPTGSECRIDLVSQAWSVLSGIARPERQAQAMAAVERLLWAPRWQLLRLLDPPLSQQQPAAGYIQAYPPGVRENGGQYTHAVVWAGMAWARLGWADSVWRAWQCCSPAHRSADPVLGPRFGMEPYAVTADICSQPPLAGRGGWSWYSGSAAGLYRLAIESICGLELNGPRLRFDPQLPSHWPVVHLRLQRHGRTWHFSLCRSEAAQALAEAASEGARPLAVREWLVTDGADGSTRCLIVLPPGGQA
ncbi:glucoamylase family protein [Pelomonas sp. APW6]|uniref:Glucoamylase family protein n=1 Tax=Roseateles subflavus TaxID=3053353 RepID=A0ABT7LEG5_9BURK|nr:glucoamylase family protein [Pelomonas sp. APW6]MDL5031249.1 glucoamylase family protein [Pelomonas sp. APW6]